MSSMRSQPVAGYPSKMAAAVALKAQGLHPEQIAARIGSTPAAVRFSLRTARNRALQSPSHQPDATPGIWTAEKRDKVRRLYGKTLIMIAEAVHVPADELLRYVIHGVVPPSQKIRNDADIDWRDPEQPASREPLRETAAHQKQLPAPALTVTSISFPSAEELERLVPYGTSPAQTAIEDVKLLEAAVEQLAIAAGADPKVAPEVVAAIGATHQALALLDTPEPDRDDDEAELARLAALEAAGVPVVVEEEPALFRLQHKTGAWLDRSLASTTYKLPQAWKGTAADIERVYVMMPRVKSYDVRPCR